jgi:NAD(P)-dependent dehydrogenase (short-subunit alcohol dehydrogenase family)
MRLSGKRAVITRGAKGIGAAIVRVFVREGARVCINTLEPVSSCDALIEELKALSASGGDAFACRADVRNETQISAMLKLQLT